MGLYAEGGELRRGGKITKMTLTTMIPKKWRKWKVIESDLDKVSKEVYEFNAHLNISDNLR